MEKNRRSKEKYGCKSGRGGSKKKKVFHIIKGFNLHNSMGHGDHIFQGDRILKVPKYHLMLVDP